MKYTLAGMLVTVLLLIGIFYLLAYLVINGISDFIGWMFQWI